MGKIIKLTESELTNIVKRVVNEDNRKSEKLYSKINDLIYGEYSKLVPMDISYVLNRVIKDFKNDVYLKQEKESQLRKDNALKSFSDLFNK